MKVILIVACFFIWGAKAQEEIVNIPDNVFKTYLLGQTGININGDNEIQVSEANAFTGEINVTNLGISDLTGIESFTSLPKLMARNNNLTFLNVSNNTALIDLNCAQNQLSTLDLSNNIALMKLECSYNQLTALDISINTALTNFNSSYNPLSSLDVTNNTALVFLSCAENQLSALDVYSNTALSYLSCYNNQLTSLDVSNNPALTLLAFGNNKLTSLDISGNLALTYLACFNNKLISLNIANGNNTNFTTLNTTGNPDLVCIQVDDEDYSNANWTGGSLQKDAASTFSEDCETLRTSDFTIETTRVYPNPATDFVYITKAQEAKIFDLTGKLLIHQNIENSIDISFLNSGIYILETSEGVKMKFVKK